MSLLASGATVPWLAGPILPTLAGAWLAGELQAASDEQKTLCLSVNGHCWNTKTCL